jgi:nucleotide-binding universal stress UspA family protein
VVFAYDGSPAAADAIRAAAGLVGPCAAVVATVWEEGLAVTSLLPSGEFGMAPGPIDVETALEVDEAVEANAARLAAEGAALARAAGFDPAEPVAVADEVSVAETLVHVAEQRGADVLVLGTGKSAGRLRSRLLGSTAHAVLRRAHVPVLVVPAPAG